MKLYVQVVEAKDLSSRDPNGFSDPFVRLSLGNTKARTSVVYKNLNPCWNEDFFFNVTDLDDELKVTVWDEDRFTDDFLGQTRISVADVLNSDKQSMPCSWFCLQKRSEKSKINVKGEILLDISLFGSTFNSGQERQSQAGVTDLNLAHSSIQSSGDYQEEQSPSSTDSGHFEVTDRTSELKDESLPQLEQLPRGTVLNQDSALVRVCAEVGKKMDHGQTITDKLSSIFQKKGKKSNNRPTFSSSSSVASDYSTDALFSVAGTITSEASLVVTDYSESGDDDEGLVPLSFFQDDEKSVGQSPEELPPPLSGGVLVDQTFAVSMKALNAVLFKPETPFSKELVEVQKTSEVVEGPWKKIGNDPM